MKLFWSWVKDGGPESRVWMRGFEWKRGFSVLLLRFEHGSREAYHSHAFNAVSWVLGPRGRDEGGLLENHFAGHVEAHFPGLRPIVTRRSTFHKVSSLGRTYVLSLRGSWQKNWLEHTASGFMVLTHGRKATPLSGSALPMRDATSLFPGCWE